MPTETASPLQEIVLVTGPAGAGRSTAIRALEDLGFEAIDNLPLALVPRLLSGPPVGRPLAIGVDPRTRDCGVAALLALVEEVAGDPAFALTLLYVDCDASVLIRRYSETRRRHPLSPHEAPRVGIEAELALLGPIRARAGVLIDTSAMTPHDLRAEIGGLFVREEGSGLAVTLQSFSYKRGVPRGIDMVMDVRFLRNPHWDAHLRPMDGRDREVAAYVARDPNWQPFTGRLADMMRFLLPAYRAEGKAYFTLGLGCTGGRHRSVAAVEWLGKALAQDGWRVSIRHRDLVEPDARARPAAQGVGSS
ncbi:RNase adapter RapZ [soil metagenome]